VERIEFPSESRRRTYAKLKSGDHIEGAGGESEAEDDEGDQNGGQSDPPTPPPGNRRRMIAPGTQEHVFTLQEGPAVLTCPEGMSEESAEDLQDWLKLVMRKIKRSVGHAEQTKRVATSDEDDEPDLEFDKDE
jgi:hypothetical protein